jgi:parallel beta-helix repeat protein
MTHVNIRLLLCLSIAGSAFGQTIEVSPEGPIKTLAEAREKARAAHQGGAAVPPGGITIRLHAGAYQLAEPLVLTPEDSNTVWEAAPGQRVVISGGRAIRGWQKSPRGPTWTAPAGEPYFRQLFISGRRAQRARTPNFGFFRIDGPSSQDKPFLLKYRGNDIKPEWARAGDVEVVALLAWADLRMPIVSVDEASHSARLTLDPRPSNRENDARYWIENAPDALDYPGEWYLDRQAGAVSYWPLPGEDLTKEEVIAPALVQLVRLEGAPERGELVRRVTFRNLEFAYTEWTMPAKGYADMQASILTAPTAFEAVGAEECAIEHCAFRQIGGYAIWFGRGSKRNRVVANEIWDAGGGGVKIGEVVRRTNPAEQAAENLVADNHIHNLGQVFPPAVGVWIGQSSRNTVSHNHIHDLYYTAVSVGWTWGYGPHLGQGNIVEFNHLHHVGQEMLSDMGGIYTLGIQPGSVLRNNLIHDVAAFVYGGWGIYPDEGTSEMLIENNVVYNCKNAGFHQHYGRENMVRNNIFAFNGQFELMRSRSEPHVSFTFERNIVYFDGGRLLGGNWSPAPAPNPRQIPGSNYDSRNPPSIAGPTYKFDRNLYYDLRGPDIRFAGRSFKEWQEAGQDAQSKIADPLFVNPANFDFRLRPGSPALAMGFQQIDLSVVGPRLAPGPQR